MIAKFIREKPVVNLETTPKQKRAEWNSAPKPESAGTLTKQAAEVSVPRALSHIFTATSLQTVLYFI